MTSHPTVVHDLNSITTPFKGILLDAYGVFWGGNRMGLLPGSKRAMEHLVAQGKIVGILSNTTQLAHQEKEKLKGHGLIEGQDFHFLLTAGEIAKDLFAHSKLPFVTPHRKFWVWGGSHPKYVSYHAMFQDTPYTETSQLKEADFIYLSIPHLDGEDQTHPEVFRESVKLLNGCNLPMVCANPDLFAHEGNPPKAVVRQGSIAALYEEIGGQVHYIGKPYPLAYESAMQRFSQFLAIQPEEVLMVGDTPETDIRGARQFGMSAALVTQTGVMADRISTHGAEKTFNKLLNYDIPNFFIERLASNDLYSSS